MKEKISAEEFWGKRGVSAESVLRLGVQYQLVSDRLLREAAQLEKRASAGSEQIFEGALFNARAADEKLDEAAELELI